MRIGIDLGGTKIEAIALSPAGQEITRLRVATPRDYAASLDAIAGLVRELERAAGGQGTVGVGIPGTVVPRTGLVKNANSTWLNGQPLERDLVGRLGRPVRVMNDANCFALSEATDGAAAGAPVVFGVILGTGVGGGIVVDGRCLAGANLIAGEWGHNPLPWVTPDEQPGRRATAASAAVSRRGSPDRGSSATTHSTPVSPCPARRSWEPRRAATRAPQRPWPDTTIG